MELFTILQAVVSIAGTIYALAAYFNHIDTKKALEKEAEAKANGTWVDSDYAESWDY